MVLVSMRPGRLSWQSFVRQWTNTLRMKLTTFLSQYAAAQGDSFTVPFDRASMANFLGADRSALSRELSNMRREGIIDYHHNWFRILKK